MIKIQIKLDGGTNSTMATDIHHNDSFGERNYRCYGMEVHFLHNLNYAKSCNWDFETYSLVFFLNRVM